MTRLRAMMLLQMPMAGLLALCAVQLTAVQSQDVHPTGKMINGGTPPGVPPTFDCKARAAAWEYGK
eukprot:COSAG02_NODE_1711_length_11223_cov_5.622348_7_plen_66_part_00